MNVILIGFMGAGKSTVSRLLADRLGYTCVDTDALVEAAAGNSVANLFASRGEPAFREMERAAVRAACGESCSVISTGGGAPGDPTNRSVLRGAGTVVWLRASVPSILERISDCADRPLFARFDDPSAGIRDLLASREAGYAAAAHYAVDTDGLSPDAVTDLIVARLESGPDASA